MQLSRDLQSQSPQSLKGSTWLGSKSCGANDARSHSVKPSSFVQSVADCCCDVGAHALEGIAAAGPGVILVVARDQVGADVADGELGDVLGHAELRHQRARGAAQIVQTEV